MVMDKWASMFRNNLEKAKIQEYLMEKYVDDVNIMTEIIDIGWAWKKENREMVFQ